jgi:hypothetical protein
MDEFGNFPGQDGDDEAAWQDDEDYNGPCLPGSWYVSFGYSFYEHGQLIEGDFIKLVSARELAYQICNDWHLVWFYLDGGLYELQTDGSWKLDKKFL